MGHAFGKQASQQKQVRLGAGISALKRQKQINATLFGIS